MIRRGLIWSIPPLAAIAILSVYGWIAAPGDAQIPVHWNIRGEVDRYASKAEAMLVMPVIALMATGLFVAVAGLDPHRENIRRSSTPLLVGWIGLLAVLAVVHAAIVLVATGAVSGEDAPVRVSLAAVAALLVVLGNVLPKARTNWTVGVRTRWSLSSEYSWEKSQRLGGWLFAAAGLLVLAAVFTLPVQATLLLLLASVLAAAIASAVMSYVWWRRDPSRRREGG